MVTQGCRQCETAVSYIGSNITSSVSYPTHHCLASGAGQWIVHIQPMNPKGPVGPNRHCTYPHLPILTIFFLFGSSGTTGTGLAPRPSRSGRRRYSMGSATCVQIMQGMAWGMVTAQSTGDSCTAAPSFHQIPVLQQFLSTRM
jgi:hypothetical protein